MQWYNIHIKGKNANVASSFHFALEAHNALDGAKNVLAAQGRLPDDSDMSLQDKGGRVTTYCAGAPANYVRLLV